MTETIAISKAQPIGKDYPVPSVTIELSTTVPDFVTLEAAHCYYNRQATLLEVALNETLPGGTYHALLVRMLERKVSLLRVPQGEPKAAP